MPLRAVDSLKQSYNSTNFDKSIKDISCPNCEIEFIFVDAILKVKHFRHKYNNDSCENEPETEEHLKIKNRIFEILKNDGINTDIELEHKIGNQIADVYCKHGDITYVIECQCSIITNEEVNERTIGSADKNVYLLWIWGKKYYRLDRKTFFYNISSVIRDKFLFYSMNPLKVIKRIKISLASRYIQPTDFGGGYDKNYKTKRKLDFEDISDPKIIPYYSIKKEFKSLEII